FLTVDFLLKYASGLSLGITTVIIADVIDYGELKFSKRADSIIVSSQTFLMKTAMAVAGLLTGVGLEIVGYIPDAVQTPGTILGIRVMMFVIPFVFVLASLIIYKKAYKLKGDYLNKMVMKLNTEKISLREKKNLG